MSQLSSALYTSLNALQLNEMSISVIGNNIANANTNGFKQSSVLFATQLAQTISLGSGPSANNGGANPIQIGLGAMTSAIAGDFTSGSITSNSNPSSLAIQGNGFFVLNNGDGGSVYTRDGQFTLNSANNLINGEGLQVQGYGVDGNGNLVTTALQNLSIPVGQLQSAAATKNLTLGGALLTTGAVATQGSLLTSAPLVSTAGGTTAVGTDLLTNIRLASAPTQTLFTNGETLSFTPDENGLPLQPQTLTVSATTTLSDLATFMGEAAGLQTGSAGDPVPVDADGIPVGVSITAGGSIQVKGNDGSVNALDFPDGSLTSTGNSIALGFTAGPNAANGESTSTNFVAYDSLGQPVNLTVTAVLQSRNSSGSVFRYFVQGADSASGGPNVAVGTGTVTFNTSGQVVSQPNNTFSLVPTDGAASPQLVNIDFSKVSGIATAATGSTLTLAKQDGAPPGTLTSYVINKDGTITGVFDNGITKTLGQVALAQFNNPQGLIVNGGNTYSAGQASGLAQIVQPGALGSGTIQSGAVELSNTNVSTNLVGLIQTDTAYQGNAKVISTVNNLLNDLLQIIQQ